MIQTSALLPRMRGHTALNWSALQGSGPAGFLRRPRRGCRLRTTETVEPGRRGVGGNPINLPAKIRTTTSWGRIPAEAGVSNFRGAAHFRGLTAKELFPERCRSGRGSSPCPTRLFQIRTRPRPNDLPELHSARERSWPVDVVMTGKRQLAGFCFVGRLGPPVGLCGRAPPARSSPFLLLPTADRRNLSWHDAIVSR